MGFDVVLLNELGVLVADGICRNFLRECVDVDPLDVNNVGMLNGKNRMGKT